jgi:hypothetical protein
LAVAAAGAAHSGAEEGLESVRRSRSLSLSLSHGWSQAASGSTRVTRVSACTRRLTFPTKASFRFASSVSYREGERKKFFSQKSGYLFFIFYFCAQKLTNLFLSLSYFLKVATSSAT